MSSNKVAVLDQIGTVPAFGKPNGLHWFTAALFVVADMAGGGIVAFPVAMVQSGGVVGLSLIISIAIVCCYTAHALSENWIIMCTRWKQYEEHCRKPYPEMAYRAMGNKARIITSLVLDVVLFGVSVVFSLLSSTIISDLIASIFGYRINFCFVLVIVIATIYPVTLLRSPQDFWWAVVFAMLTTVISVVLILVGIMLDYDQCSPVAEHERDSLSTIMASMGTFMFGLGSHAVFPSIQHDMKHPKKFIWSAVIGFIAVSAMYIPVSYYGYVTYGDALTDSVISSIQTEWIQMLANFFIAAHCFLTLTVVINPLNQEVENLVRAPHHFGWQRVAVRTFVILMVLLAAETVPKFGPILNLIGGSTISFTSAILPLLFNLFLRAATFDEGHSKKYQRPTIWQVIERTPKIRLILNILIIVVAFVLGAATTYMAISDIASTDFTMPCYLSFLNADSNQTVPTWTAPSCQPIISNNITELKISERKRKFDASDAYDKMPKQIGFSVREGVRYLDPYWSIFRAWAKGRWIGRRLVDVFSEEFLSLSPHYAAAACKMGRIWVNGSQMTDTNYIFGNNDCIEHIGHRHEHPILNEPIKIIANTENMLVIDKPPSMPVHACGRYCLHTVLGMLNLQHNLQNLRVIHRLDRTTSGVLLFAKNFETDVKLKQSMKAGEWHKEYVCKVEGVFPGENEVVCDKPIGPLVITMGIQCVRDDGKPAVTRFRLISTDNKTSILRCFLETGRTHQIRVHLQYLGFPIVDDYIYNTDVWGPLKGKDANYGKSLEQLRKDVMDDHRATKWIEHIDADYENRLLRIAAAEPNVDSASLSTVDRPSHDPICLGCNTKRKDTQPTQLFMHLHCLRYETSEGTFTSEMPKWATDTESSDHCIPELTDGKFEVQSSTNN